jgi:hypothetical protein
VFSRADPKITVSITNQVGISVRPSSGKRLTPDNTDNRMLLRSKLETSEWRNRMKEEIKDETTELNTQTDEAPANVEGEGNEIDRRRFFGSLAGVLGTTAAIGAIGLTAKAQEQTQAKEIKGKILSRIQQQLNQEPGAEGMIYAKADEHHKGGAYSKGVQPVMPIAE